MAHARMASATATRVTPDSIVPQRWSALINAPIMVCAITDSATAIPGSKETAVATPLYVPCQRVRMEVLDNVGVGETVCLAVASVILVLAAMIARHLLNA